MRVLLVEDDLDIAASLGDFLEAAGVQVDFAYNTVQALARVDAATFDVLVLDVNLPDGDGYSLCQQLRKQGLATPVVFLTARGELADKLQGFAEDRLRLETIPADRLVAFFDRYPPQSNFARGQYALAKATLRPAEALEIIRAAWRGGDLDPGTEATLLSTYGRYFTQDDQDARMDALLWQRNSAAAARRRAICATTSMR